MSIPFVEQIVIPFDMKRVYIYNMTSLSVGIKLKSDVVGLVTAKTGRTMLCFCNALLDIVRCRSPFSFVLLAEPQLNLKLDFLYGALVVRELPDTSLLQLDSEIIDHIPEYITPDLDRFGFPFEELKCVNSISTPLYYDNAVSSKYLVGRPLYTCAFHAKRYNSHFSYIAQSISDHKVHR